MFKRIGLATDPFIRFYESQESHSWMFHSPFRYDYLGSLSHRIVKWKATFEETVYSVKSRLGYLYYFIRYQGSLFHIYRMNDNYLYDFYTL